MDVKDLENPQGSKTVEFDTAKTTELNPTEVVACDSAEESVSKFYNSVGWVTENNTTEDAKRFEDLRKHTQEYAIKTRNLVMDYIPKRGEHIIDMASGPIQYEEYLNYSKNFRKRWCVDLSTDALKMAEEKIGDHGIFLNDSFFKLPFEDNFFDCAISLHTIYHMNKEKQEEAVRKLIRITKTGRPVIIIYSNPNVFWNSSLFRKLGLLKGERRTQVGKDNKISSNTLYFDPHPLSWWNRFTDEAGLEMVPWRSFGPAAQKKIIPNNWLGKQMLRVLFRLERTFPKFFVKHFTYPMIILRKQ
jgi:ubiquinone/menaquinone biosynthesis C-methylase UbiE